MRENAGDQRWARRRLRRMKSARSAARTATAAIPPAMPPIWAWLRLEDVDWVAAGVVVDVTGAGATVVLVELEVGVGVTIVDEEVLLVACDVVVGVATTMDPEFITNVATSVACVSGAALVILLHMPYAALTVAAVHVVSYTSSEKSDGLCGETYSHRHHCDSG